MTIEYYLAHMKKTKWKRRKRCRMNEYSNMKSESQQEKRERLKEQSSKKKQDVKKVDKEVRIVQSLKDQHPSIYKR